MGTRLFRGVVSVLLIAAVLWAKTGLESRLAEFERPNPSVNLQTAAFHSRSLQKFSLGFNTVIADLLWVHLLQAADHRPLKEGGVSWEYAMLDGLLTLDPRFHTAYSFGASFVFIFRKDRTGARALLERWTRAAPLDWRSHYNLGFFLFHDERRYAEAAPAILRATALDGAPEWLSSLGVRLLSESGAHLSSLQTAMGLYGTLTDDEAKFRLRRNIRSLNYLIQKAAFTAEQQQAVNSPERQLAAAAAKLEVPEELRELMEERFRFRFDPATKTAQGLIRPEDQYLETAGIYHASQESP